MTLRLNANGKVDCYYTREDGVVEKHELWSVDWEEASRGRYCQTDAGRQEFIVPSTASRWSLEPPEEEVKVVDRTPMKMEELVKSIPPPADRPAAVDPLKRGPGRTRRTA